MAQENFKGHQDSDQAVYLPSPPAVAMGSSFSFHPDVQSPSCPGEKSALSDPVQTATPEQLMVGMEKYVRDGKTTLGVESKFEVMDKGDHLLTVSEFELPAIFGGGSGSTFTTYTFDKEKLEMKYSHFQSRRHYEGNDPQSISTVRVHRDPVVIEHWVDYSECRGAGLLMEKMLGKVLKEMGTAARAVPESRSPGDPSKLSVMSEPIEDVEVTPQTFLAFFKKLVVETFEGAELPDGTVVEERGSELLQMFGLMAKSIAKHEFDVAENHVHCHEFGEDESMVTEIGVTHVQVHTAPFRLEQYHITRPGRRSGEAQVKLIQAFIEGTLKHIGG